MKPFISLGRWFGCGQKKDHLLSGQKRWAIKRENKVPNLLCCLLVQLLNGKSMFAALHSNTSSLKPGLFHLTGQPYSENGREELFLETIFLGLSELNSAGLVAHIKLVGLKNHVIDYRGKKYRGRIQSTHFLHNFTNGPLSQSVCPFIAFPAQ